MHPAASSRIGLLRQSQCREQDEGRQCDGIRTSNEVYCRDHRLPRVALEVTCDERHVHNVDARLARRQPVTLYHETLTRSALLCLSRR